VATKEQRVTKLHDLYEQGGQSPWIDDLRRGYLHDGGLQRLVDRGVRGVTSNPTIMAKAIDGSDDYDSQFSTLISGGASIDSTYWELVLDDIRGALAVLRPVYDTSSGADGFVSVEVAPALAHDTARTVTSAHDLHDRVSEPNLMVKIPATAEGVPAINSMIASGKSINVTLIFSLERYDEVIEAYLSGLEQWVAAGNDPTHVASVASFFVSRVDTEVDRRLEAIASDGAGAPRAAQALALRGKAAVAQAQVAYEHFRAAFDSERFAALAARGARVQRPLWASTSTKNPAYPDLLYVENLIGPDTVNTMPEPTIEAFEDHGVVDRRVDRDPAAARRVLDDLAEVGIDLESVTAQLEAEAVASFAKSFDEVGASLSVKAAEIGTR
jgi:transaldolase